MAMFKYTHEVILNSLVAEDGTANARIAMLADPSLSVNHMRLHKEELNKNVPTLVIQRGGEYKIPHIVNNKVYKTKGYKGMQSKLQITCTDLIAKDENGNYEAGLYNFAFAIVMPNRFYGEFANANWYGFGKPIMVGFEISADAAADGEATAKVLAKAIKMAIPENNKFLKVTQSGDIVEVIAVDPYAHFKGVALQRYDPTVCDSCLGEYFPREVSDKVRNLDGFEPFATGEWLIENLRFPSQPNLRYAALYADEYPQAGAVYVEYTFAYAAARLGLGGLSGVGQDMAAISKHVFYVREDLADKFDEILSGAGVTIEDAGYTVRIMNANTVSIQDLGNTGVAFTAQEVPVKEGATYTWTVTTDGDGDDLTIENGVLRTNNAVAGQAFWVTAKLDGTDAETTLEVRARN